MSKRKHWWWASVYRETQHYGGPEEGGWYFTRREWRESERFPSKEEAMTRAKELLTEENYTCVEKTPGSREYLGTPRYE